MSPALTYSKNKNRTAYQKQQYILGNFNSKYAMNEEIQFI